MNRSSLWRVWWAAPGALLVGSAVAVAIVVGPSLGEQVSVPRELVVPTAGAGQANGHASPATTHPLPTRKPPTRPASPPGNGTGTPSSTQSQTTHVVQPRRPVVTASPEQDSHESPGSNEHEGGDG